MSGALALALLVALERRVGRRRRRVLVVFVTLRHALVLLFFFFVILIVANFTDVLPVDITPDRHFSVIVAIVIVDVVVIVAADRVQVSIVS
jgi:hypothetical protein